MAHTVTEIMVQELCELRNKVEAMERVRGVGNAPTTQIRSDAATPNAMTPEIRRLENELAQHRKHAELTAKAGPGRLIEVVEPDAAGRQIRSFYGDPAAVWDRFKAPKQFVVGWGAK